MSFSASAEVIVKAESIVFGPASYVETENNVPTKFYGGVAGACDSAAKDSVNLCNSCINSTSIEACNLSSIYSTLQFTVQFQVTKDVTGKAALYFLNSSDADQGGAVEIASATYTANTTVVTLNTTWQSICNAGGLSSCANGTSGLYSGKIAFGLDSNNDGTVSLTDEVRKVPFTIHYIVDGTDPITTQAYCATAAVATGTGFCQAAFLEGDEKVYIDTFTVGSNTVDDTISGSSIRIDALAVFPVPTTAGSEATTVTNFLNSQATPIFKEIDSTLGIADSKVEGGLQNYQKYCFIYATKNRSQNIYRFVTQAGDAATVAAEVCKSPSENVGILEDKSCFISTATYGSSRAYQVETFRKFRNQYLLNNSVGMVLVQTYYWLSPSMSEVILKYPLVKTFSLAVLTPIYYWAELAVQWGLLEAVLLLMVLFLVLIRIKKVIKAKALVVVLALVLFSVDSKAQIIPETKKVQNHQSEDGLTRITKEGVYIYETERPLRNQSGRLMFGQAQQPEISIDIEQVDASGNGLGTFQTFIFEDFYGDASNFIISYEYEWFPWVTKGKLGLQGGISLMYATGNGIQVATLAPSVEEYTFLTIPLTFGAVYRFEYKDKQWFVPYVAGGGTYTGLLEKREDRNNVSAVAAPGFYAAGGGLFNIALLDSDSSYTLDSEYGISNLWISVEYRLIEVDSEAFGFSSRYINAGLAFDF